MIIGNGFVYYPEITISHDETGSVMQARRLQKHYGLYSLDVTQEPVAIQLLLKNAVSEACTFEEKDYQLALKIQSDLTNQRDNDHVVKLFHLMGTCITPLCHIETPSHLLAVRELVNGNAEEYGDWIRTMYSPQRVFSRVVEGYSRLLEIGYYHCNLCLENVLLQLKADATNPNITWVEVKLTGFEEAVPRSQPIVPFQDHVKGKTSYAAPEVEIEWMLYL